MSRIPPASLALLVVVHLVACGPISDGGGERGPTITPRDGETSEIRGQVVSYPEGEPIPEMSVVVFDVQARYQTFPTDGDGRYVATGLHPGFYRIKAWPLDGQDHIGAYYDDTYFYCTGRVLDLRGGVVAEGVDFRLPHGGALEGTVTDGVSGEPMEQVRVDVKGLDYYNNNLDPTTYTDADGHFRIVGLDSAIDDPETMNPVPGNYELKLTAPGRPVIYYPGVYTLTDAEPVGAIRGETTTGLDLAIPPGGQIAGAVVDAEGFPVEDGLVKAVHSVEPWIQASASLLSGGLFTAGGLAPGEYKLQVTAGGHGAMVVPDPVVLEEDGTVAGLEIELQAEATVGGQLLADGAPLEGGLIQVVPLGGVSATTWSLEDGGFVVYGLGAGDAYLYVMPGDDLHLPGYVCGGSLCSSTAEATLLTLAAGDAVELGPIECPQAATISGQVLQREGDVPLGRIYVTALPEAEGQPSVLAVTEEEDGRFVLGGMRPGTYSLSAEPYRYCTGDPGWVTTYSGDARRPETAELLALQPGDAATAELRLPSDVDGDAMSDVWEWLHFLDPARDDALEDPDLDGTLNLDEYLERSDPRDDLGSGCDHGPGPARAGGLVLVAVLTLLALVRARCP